MKRRKRAAYKELIFIVSWLLFLLFVFVVHHLGYSIQVIEVGFIVTVSSLFIVTYLLRAKSPSPKRTQGKAEND